MLSTEPSQAVINHGEKDASPWKCTGLSGLERIARGQLNSSAYDIA